MTLRELMTALEVRVLTYDEGNMSVFVYDGTGQLVPLRVLEVVDGRLRLDGWKANRG